MSVDLLLRHCAAARRRALHSMDHALRFMPRSSRQTYSEYRVCTWQ
jgi:hypothetical protein